MVQSNSWQHVLIAPLTGFNSLTRLRRDSSGGRILEIGFRSERERITSMKFARARDRAWNEEAQP